MKLSEISIRRPVLAWMLMTGLILFGLLSFRRMGINENPDVDFPTVTVRYSYDGATPQVIEKDIIDPVESVLVSMNGIRNLTATANRGSADIQIEFELSQDIDFALQEVQTLLGRAQRDLPDSVDPPVVTKSNAADDPVVYLALRTSKLSPRELMLLFRDHVRDHFATIEGVAEVRAFGYHEPMLRIDLHADKLARYQLTAQDVVASIEREHVELPAGTFESEREERQIRILGEGVTAEDFRGMIISRRGGQPNYRPITLEQVADVYEGIENLRRISRVNGEFALGMAVQKQKGANAVATADRVIAKLDEINRQIPEGTRLEVNFDRTRFIRESVDELIFTLGLAALLTSFVCWIFLGSWSATSNILLAIPTSVVGTFILIHQFGFTLNTFTLLGLALAIGVVVDDAIVMLENIVRFLQKGFNRVDAAFKGSRQVGFAVLVTTLALVSIFIPITFMDGIEGKFFFEFAVTLSIAVSLSSLEALTLAPMRCSQFLSAGPRTSRFGRMFESGFSRVEGGYRRSLEWALNHKVSVITAALVVFGLSLVGSRHLKKEFAPAQDRGSLFIMFQTPDGSSLEFTNRKVKELEKVLAAHPDIKRYIVSVGGFGRGGLGNRGNGIAILKDRHEREKSQFEVAEELRRLTAGIEGLRLFVRDRSGSAIGGRRGSPVEFVIQGPDSAEQRRLYHVMKERMEAGGRIVGVRSDDVSELPEMWLVPDRREALRRGVEISEIARIANATFGGVVAGQYTTGGRRFDIYVQLRDEDRRKRENLNRLLVRNNRGELIPLSQVVRVEDSLGPESIFRENRLRAVRVDADLKPGVSLGDAVAEVKTIAGDVLPEGYRIRFSDELDDSLQELLWIFGLGLVVAYMILAAQFNSFYDPFIVFLAVPFGISGAIFGLLATGQSMNVYSAIGILMTMGIVKKNSILLVEFANQLRDEGHNPLSAMRQACATRLRPILMTTASTLAAALPPALALGPGAETRIPMAVVILGGVFLSTMLTLLVVPCIYTALAVPRRRIPVETPDEASSEVHLQAG